MGQATFRIFRGDNASGEFKDYTAEVGEEGRAKSSRYMRIRCRIVVGFDAS
jgi:hypothetical protein